MPPSELLPFQRQAPFVWPIDPTASDPTTRGYWVAWAAAKCADEPSVEALWVRIVFAAYALLRMGEALKPHLSDPAGIRANLARLEKTFGRHLPRRCFRPRLGDDQAIGFAIAIGQIAERVDLLAEELVHGWDIGPIIRVGNCETYRDGAMEIVRRCRGQGGRFPVNERFMGLAAYAAFERTAVKIPHFGLPMPWAAGLLATVERAAGSCDAPCPIRISSAEAVYLLRSPDPGRSLLLRIEIGEDPELGPAEDLDAFDGLRSSHPLFPFFGDDLPRLFAEYRAWRALAGQPIFQDTGKWHPDDEEIV